MNIWTNDPSSAAAGQRVNIATSNLEKPSVMSASPISNMLISRVDFERPNAKFTGAVAKRRAPQRARPQAWNVEASACNEMLGCSESLQEVLCGKNGQRQDTNKEAAPCA